MSLVMTMPWGVVVAVAAAGILGAWLVLSVGWDMLRYLLSGGGDTSPGTIRLRRDLDALTDPGPPRPRARASSPPARHRMTGAPLTYITRPCGCRDAFAHVAVNRCARDQARWQAAQDQRALADREREFGGQP